MDKVPVIRSVAGFLFALAASACGPETSKRPLTVDQVISQIDLLNGRTVSVVGYLSECESNSCRLYRNKAEADEVDRAMTAIRAASEAGSKDVSGFPFPNHPALGIGSGSRYSFFDLRASFFAKGHVVITGKVSNACRSKNVICFDRSSELEPSAIRAATVQRR